MTHRFNVQEDVDVSSFNRASLSSPRCNGCYSKLSPLWLGVRSWPYAVPQPSILSIGYRESRPWNPLSRGPRTTQNWHYHFLRWPII